MQVLARHVRMGRVPLHGADAVDEVAQLAGAPARGLLLPQVERDGEHGLVDGVEGFDRDRGRAAAHLDELVEVVDGDAVDEVVRVEAAAVREGSHLGDGGEVDGEAVDEVVVLGHGVVAADQLADVVGVQSDGIRGDDDAVSDMRW